MKQSRINYYEVVVYELFIKEKNVRCPACRGFLDLEADGIGRVVVERIVDLINEGRDRFSNLRLVHFRCRRKSIKNDQATKANRFSKEGKSPREIAIALDMSLATIYSYLKEAKPALEPPPAEVDDKW